MNLWKGKKNNTSNVILRLAGLSNSPTFDTNFFNVNKKYQIKWCCQGRHGRLLWNSFQLTVLFKLFIHITFINSLWKKELAELFQIPCSLQVVTCCYNRLWEFSVTKPICYKDVFVNSFCFPEFRHGNYLVAEPFIWLII